MRYVIKCLSEDGFGFPSDMDYRIFFPERCEVSSTGSSSVIVTLPWGSGTFKFGTFTITADFEYRSIDFGYTEPFMNEVAARVSLDTKTRNKWWQVPALNSPAQK
jgi:hypothetical protein